MHFFNDATLTYIFSILKFRLSISNNFYVDYLSQHTQGVIWILAKYCNLFFATPHSVSDRNKNQTINEPPWPLSVQTAYKTITTSVWGSMWKIWLWCGEITLRHDVMQLGTFWHMAFFKRYGLKLTQPAPLPDAADFSETPSSLLLKL